MQPKISSGDFVGIVHAYPTIAAGLQSAKPETYLKSAARAETKKYATGLSFTGLIISGFFKMKQASGIFIPRTFA